MAWNESSNGGDKDPWGQGGRKQEGPPDLDEIARKVREKVSSALRGKGGGGRGGRKGSGRVGFMSFGFILIAVFVLWVISGIFIVSPMKRGVVLRFGKYVRTLEPGPHWIPRFIESAALVNVQEVLTFDYTDQMLTKDENIVEVSLSVMYRRAIAKDYLYNVVNPRGSIKQATASALRQVIGDSTLDVILTTGRQQVRDDVQQQLILILGVYKTGIDVVDVNLQPAKPPEPVTAAFDDAIKAREDEQRFINQAEAYDKKVRAMVRGKVVRIVQNAQADEKRMIADAKADVAHFLALLPEYDRAPEVMRQRLYIDTYESILSKTSKVLVSVKGGNNMMYLPIDKILEGQIHRIKKNADSDSPGVDSNTESTSTSTDTAYYGRRSYTGRGGYTWQQ